jgi:WD40 repeat protein
VQAGGASDGNGDGPGCQRRDARHSFPRERATGRVLRSLGGHSDNVSGVAVTADGKRAVSASSDKTVKVWDLYTGSSIATFRCDGSAHSCAIADEHRIVVGDTAGRVYFLAPEE